MPVVTESLQVTGIRCERCVNRLRGVLTGHPGLEAANANLMGELTLTWDDARTDREALLAAVAWEAMRLLSLRMEARIAEVTAARGTPDGARQRLHAVGMAYLEFAREEPGQESEGAPFAGTSVAVSTGR